jgi:hypothetical protein
MAAIEPGGLLLCSKGKDSGNMARAQWKGKNGGHNSPWQTMQLVPSQLAIRETVAAPSHVLSRRNKMAANLPCGRPCSSPSQLAIRERAALQ